MQYLGNFKSEVVHVLYLTMGAIIIVIKIMLLVILKRIINY